MKITYEKFEDHYVFSNNPTTRVYLGDASPEDFIWDELEQEKRTASCGYINKETGVKTKWEDLTEDQKSDFSFHETHDYECAYNFQNRLKLAYLGSSDKSVRYVQTKDKSLERLAWAWYLGQTLEEYDARQSEFNKKWDKMARKRPYLHNLIMANGETYYVDDENNRITPEEHREFMKKKFGDDVFEVYSTIED